MTPHFGTDNGRARCVAHVARYLRPVQRSRVVFLDVHYESKIREVLRFANPNFRQGIQLIRSKSSVESAAQGVDNRLFASVDRIGTFREPTNLESPSGRL